MPPGAVANIFSIPSVKASQLLHVENSTTSRALASTRQLINHQYQDFPLLEDFLLPFPLLFFLFFPDFCLAGDEEG